MFAFVVDDSATMRLVLTRHLGALGFDVACASGGAEAMEFLAGSKVPDLFLFDWNMPDVTGLDLVAAARKEARFGRSKILMVTSETDLALMKYALEAGANEYLMKPVNAENLQEKLSQVGMASHPEGGHDH